MNPITREESLLDGQDLTPITRKEKFIKRIYDKTQEVPTPVTREEWFLKKAGEGTSPVTIEQLNVTENGTYSETGKAYSPVIVEVPAPTLIAKTITENGTYTASEDNADGYSQVTVNVPYMEKKSASGDIASFSDGAGYPFLKVKANINPVQDLHGYDYPWVGGAGKNKFDGIYPDITNTVKYKQIRVENGTYTMSTDCPLDSNNAANIFFIAGNVSSGASTALNGVSNGISRTVTTTDGYVTVGYRTSDQSSNPELFNSQIELGSSATSYAPYSNICPISGFTGVNVTVSPTTTEGSGTVYPISWQDESGIVYGGYIDPVSGVLTKTLEGVDLGTLAWETAVNSTPTEYCMASTTLSGVIKETPDVEIANAYCDRYRTISRSNVYNSMSGIAINRIGNIYVYDEKYNTATSPSEFKVAVSGSQLVYEPKVPQTYQLTPQQINTLIGQNNVWNNTNGQTEVEYFIPIE